MNPKSVILLAALTGVCFTATAFAYAPTDRAATTPIPRIIASSVVNPQGLPARYADTIVDVTFYLDQQGRPQKIKVVSVKDELLELRLTEAFRQWRFDMSKSDKQTVAKRFILPLRLIPQA
jgi:outer membrane biosynthesis protein TonB